LRTVKAAASAAAIGLALIDTEWRRWERLIGRIGADNFTRQLFEGEAGADTWTIRDVLTHIAAWKRNTIRVAQMHEAGADLSLELTPDEILGIDVNAFNDDVYRRWRDRSVAEAIGEHRSAHAELMAILRRLPPGKIPPRPTQTWLYPATWHPRLHRLHVMDALDPL
jgi:hypothetical protein